MKTLPLLVAGAVLFLAPPPPRSTPLAATVALVAELPAGGTHAAILRRAEPPTDIILLLRSNASVEDLAAALALLADVRGRDGPAVSRDAVMVLKSRTLQRPLSAVQRLRLEGHLARLRLARPRAVAGLGSVPAIDLTVRTRSRDP